MSSSNGQHKSFRVVYPGAVLSRFRELVEGITNPVERERISWAVRLIDRALRTRADEFGEPRFHHRHLHLIVRHGSIRPVSAQFGLHEEQPVVFVQDLRPLSFGD